MGSKEKAEPMKASTKKRVLRHSLASTFDPETSSGSCDLKGLAKILRTTGGVPERINLTVASEISLLAQHYLHLLKEKEK